MGLPATISKLRQKIQKNKKKIQRVFNCKCRLSYEIAPDSFHFPLLRTLKTYFLYVKLFLNFVLEHACFFFLLYDFILALKYFLLYTGLISSYFIKKDIYLVSLKVFLYAIILGRSIIKGLIFLVSL